MVTNASPVLVLMALIQLFAADLAQIDELHYHTFNSEGTRAYNEARAVYQQLVERYRTATETTSAQLSVASLCELLYQRKYQWGMSDGN